MFTQFQNYVQKSVGTSPSTVFTCPANQQLVINQISCSNILTTNVTCSVTITRSGTTLFIVRDAVVPANSSLTCAGAEQKIVLMAGDVLRVQSNTAASIDVVVSGVLTDSNNPSFTVPSVVSGTNATVSVAASTTTLGEGGSVTFTVTTTGIADGTIMYWDNIGTTNALDFTDDLNTGLFTVTGGSGSFTRTLRNNDAVGEGNETIQMVVRLTPGFVGGGALAASPVVTVIDSPVLSGLIMHLDAGNPASYSGSGITWTDLTGLGNNVTLQNSPGFSNGAITFNGSTQWARTAGNLNLTTFDAITVEVLVRTDLTAGCYMVWEHTADWNTNTGGLGLSVHCTGAAGQANMHHTNHNTSVARNYNFTMGTGWALHTNIFSRIGDTTGRLTYVNGQLVSFVAGPGYPTGTETPAGASFANSIMYFAGRGGAGQMPGAIRLFRVYNRKLSAAEVLQNFNATINRFS